jgi:hypothetical protein
MHTVITTCIECGKEFYFGPGCFEFDDGDMCSECYTEYSTREAEYNELEAEVLTDQEEV